jgi:hypothetical protein
MLNNAVETIWCITTLIILIIILFIWREYQKKGGNKYE